MAHSVALQQGNRTRVNRAHARRDRPRLPGVSALVMLWCSDREARQKSPLVELVFVPWSTVNVTCASLFDAGMHPIVPPDVSVQSVEAVLLCCMVLVGVWLAVKLDR